MKKLFPYVCWLIPTISFAQSYSIDWYKISGGGGTSTGGTYPSLVAPSASPMPAAR